jgi:hypothetical protein
VLAEDKALVDKLLTENKELENEISTLLAKNKKFEKYESAQRVFD